MENGGGEESRTPVRIVARLHSFTCLVIHRYNQEACRRTSRRFPLLSNSRVQQGTPRHISMYITPYPLLRFLRDRMAEYELNGDSSPIKPRHAS